MSPRIDAIHLQEGNKMDLTNWLSTPIVTIDFRENYGKELLVASDGSQPQFELVPKCLANGFGEECVVQFGLRFEKGRMLPNWTELLLSPLGRIAVPPLDRKLPPWSPDKEPEYAAALDPLIAALSRADTSLERLEAQLPLFIDHSPESKRGLTIDRVRMVYLENAVGGDNPNLVVVVLSYLDGYRIKQNGAGSGPPKPR